MATVDTSSKIEMIRDQMPAVKNVVYLNTGTYGPLPRVSVEAMQAHQEIELNEGRIVPSGYPRAREIKEHARAEVANVFNCKPENVALTRHTTDGMNIGVMGLNWRSGDEIIITDMEHPGGQGPVYNIARRYGVTVRLARLGDGTGDVVGKFERLITPRTRMIVTSHLTWNTGTVLPLREIVEMARRHGVLVAADAAQSAGSIPLDVPAMGVDVYAAPGQKWLCGPEGTGAVYVSDEALDQIQPSVVGYSSAAAWEHKGGYFTPKPTAERFETGGMFAPAILGQATSLNWIRETVEHDWAYARIAELGRYTWDKLSKIDKVSMITPREQMAGLVSFCLDGVDAPVMCDELWQRGIVIRYIGTPLCARVATGFYNTEEDIDRLAAAVEEIRDCC